MLILLLGLISILSILYFLTLKVDNKKYFNYINRYNLQLGNESLSKLLNADPLGNLPTVTVSSTNTELNKYKDCLSEPLLLSSEYTANNNDEARCTTMCGADAKVVQIEDESHEYYYKSKKLKPGNYCVIEPESVLCNLRTGYVIANGLGSAVCKSKFPNLFGGENASVIVACNDEDYPTTGALLWDRAKNAPVDPSNVVMTHEDETLSDGSTFRFVCKYNDDVYRNKMLPHPSNRFHPIRDPCLRNVFSAHRDAHAVINLKRGFWRCKCGNPIETRLSKRDEKNPKAECTSCVDKIEKENKKYTITKMYDCFTVNSKLSDTVNKMPCNAEAFIRRGTTCDAIQLEMYTLGQDDTPFDAKFKTYHNIAI